MILLFVLSTIIFSAAANISDEIRNVLLGFVDQTKVSCDDMVECQVLFDELAIKMIKTIHIMDECMKLDMKITEIEKKAEDFNKLHQIYLFENIEQIEKYTHKQIKYKTNIDNKHRYEHYLNKYQRCAAKIAEITKVNFVNQTKRENFSRICFAQKEMCLNQKQNHFKKIKTIILLEGIKIIRLIKILVKNRKGGGESTFECKCKHALDQLQTEVFKKYSVLLNKQ